MKRSGSAVWQGSFKDGVGAISTASGALENAPYSVVSRFEDRPGTNPEELLGAAHAGCFSLRNAYLPFGDFGIRSRNAKSSS
jgi:osmotically inducible protein OsmC